MRTIIRNNYDPHVGDYHERIIQDEARDKTWLFDCDGVFLDITAGRGDTKVVNELGDSEVDATSQALVTTELAKKQDALTAGENITIENGVISATGSTYTAGNGLTLTGTEFAADTTVLATQTDLAGKQNTLTTAQLATVNSGLTSADKTKLDGIEAGAQKNAANTVIDANYVHTDNNFTTALKDKLDGIEAGAEVNVNADWNANSGDAQILNKPSLATVATSGSYNDLSDKPTIPTVNNATLTVTQNGTSVGTFTANSSTDTTLALTDTTYSAFIGTDGSTAGTSGLVPAPATTDAGKYLKADGTWDTVSAGPTVVQTTGTSTTDVMSQNAVTGMVYADPVVRTKVAIGRYASNEGATGSVAIGGSANSGYGAKVTGSSSKAVAIGGESEAAADGAIAIGTGSYAQAVGEFNIGNRYASNGYNSSNYRLLTGLYDPQSAHDGANKQYVDNLALGTTETVAIADTDWTALSSSDPYTYQATKTLTATIGANSTVELLNDQAVLFATYGFAIGSVDTTNNTVTIYSIGQPSVSVSLNINVKG